MKSVEGRGLILLSEATELHRERPESATWMGAARQWERRVQQRGS